MGTNPEVWLVTRMEPSEGGDKDGLQIPAKGNWARWEEVGTQER